MKPVVVLVEDNVDEGRQIREWILSDVPNVSVQWSLNTADAVEVLSKYQKRGVIGCIVLDMFYRTPMGDQGFGQHIIDGYDEIPIIVISVDERAQYLSKPRDEVPIARLEKPKNLFPVNNLRLEHQVKEFRRQLIEAVRCGLWISSLKARIAQLEKRQVLRPWISMPAIKLAGVFAFGVIAYVISTRVFSPEIQHWILGFCVLMAVHLFHHAVLFKDVSEVVETVRADVVELAMKVQLLAEKTDVQD